MTDPVRDYHRRTVHHLQHYAAGPETLDWDAQPSPWRHHAGAPRRWLPLTADTLAATWAEAQTGRAAPQPLTRASLGRLFELSFALTAWKQLGPDRWALRTNPSSGNLHPTEAWLLLDGAAGPGLPAGLYHYLPREHALEHRARLAPTADAGDRAPTLWIGLGTLLWREAWKYGERAFRYGQLDTGHALGALRFAAAALGWQARVVTGLGHAALAARLGLDRDADHPPGVEREEPEWLLQVGPTVPAWPAATALPPQPQLHDWRGTASRLDPRPMYRWPVLDAVTLASRSTTGLPAPAEPLTSAVALPRTPSPCDAAPAATLIRQRRSAQHFDRRATMPLATFWRLVASIRPDPAGVPWDVWPLAPRVHAVFYAHRVDGLAPGAYLLARRDDALDLLRAHWPGMPDPHPVAAAPAGLALWRLTEHPALAGTLRTLSCHQAIASDACVALSLLAELDDTATYRLRLQEAGLIGQQLYLQAEAEGLRGTGIGCYFDDAVHELLGLAPDGALQVLYHFTVGVPLHDPRLRSEPPYADRPDDLPDDPDGHDDHDDEDTRR